MVTRFTTPTQIDKQIHVRQALCSILLTLFATTIAIAARADSRFESLFPTANTDISAASIRLDPVIERSLACQQTECAVASCDALTAYHQYLKRLRFAARMQAYWVRKSADHLFLQLTGFVTQNIQDTERIEFAIRVVAVRKALLNAGQLLSGAASMGSTIDGQSGKPPEDMTRAELIKRIDETLEFGKDFNEIQKILTEGDRHAVPGVNLPGVMGIQGEDLDALKSHMSDAAEILIDAKTKARDSRELLALLKSGGTPQMRTSLGQIAARILARIADERIKEAEAGINRLVADIESREALQTGLLMAYAPYADRRDALLDLSSRIENLIQFSGPEGGGLVRCIQRHCPSANLDYSFGPDGVPATLIGDLKLGVDGGAKPGEALVFWNDYFAKAARSPPALPAIDKAVPELSLSRIELLPSQSTTATLKAPACPESDYMLRVLAPDYRPVSHLPVSQSRSSARIEPRSGTGRYQVQLLDRGTEIASQAFRVTDIAQWAGVWDYEYEDTRDGSQAGRIAINRKGEIYNLSHGGGGRLRPDKGLLRGKTSDGGAWVEMQPGDNPNELRGTWYDQQLQNSSQDRFGHFSRWVNQSRKDWLVAEGKERWTRTPHPIHAIELVRPGPNTDYRALERQCATAVVMGNTPEFHMRIITENLPHGLFFWLTDGMVKARFPDEPGILINETYFKQLEDGREIIILKGWLRCYPGSSRTFRIQPGPKTLAVGTEKTTFDMTFTHYSAHPQVTQMVFVQLEGMRHEAIDTPILPGERIALEVTFNTAPEQDRYDVPVTLNGPEPKEIRIPVHRRPSDPAVFRSKAMIIER